MKQANDSVAKWAKTKNNKFTKIAIVYQQIDIIVEV